LEVQQNLEDFSRRSVGVVAMPHMVVSVRSLKEIVGNKIQNIETDQPPATKLMQNTFSFLGHGALQCCFEKYADFFPVPDVLRSTHNIEGAIFEEGQMFCINFVAT
jgi:hypothetical protein